MKAKLYVLRGAHPSRSAMLMLDHKGIDYDTVTLPAGFQPYVIRYLGFRPRPGFSRRVDNETPRMLRKADRMGTVPALRLGDRRMTTNHDIARFLDELQAEPPLLPTDPEPRRPGEAAELPGMLDRIDQWIEEGVLNGDELYVADFMIAPSLAILTYRADGAEEIEPRPARQLLDRLLPEPSRGKPPDRSLSVASLADRS